MFFHLGRWSALLGPWLLADGFGTAELLPLLPRPPPSSRLWQMVWGQCFQKGATTKARVCLTEHFCSAQQHHRIFWAVRDHKDHRVQCLSTTNLQILQDPKEGCPELQLNVYSQLCTPPALGLICAKPCHKIYARKSKSMLAAWSPRGLTQPPLWCPKLGSWWWQWEVAGESLHFPRAPTSLCRMNQHVSLNWQQLGYWVWCFLYV